MKTKRNVVCWFEIYVNDMERAKKFYSNVLALDFTGAEMPPDMGEMKMAFFPGDENAPNASGALVQMKGVKPEGLAAVSTVVYFESEDCSVEESRVQKEGGTIHQSKFSIGEYGYISLCMDTEGNTFGIHSMK